MVKFFLSIVIFIFVFFSSKVSSENLVKVGNSAIQSFGKSLKKEKGWFLTGFGGSYCDPDNIQLIMTLECHSEFSLEEARVVYIETVEKFINFINKNEKYRKIFKNSKFTINNLKVSFIFTEENGGFVDSQYIAGIIFAKGNLIYFYSCDHRRNFDQNSKIKETYEEAYANVTNKK